MAAGLAGLAYWQFTRLSPPPPPPAAPAATPAPQGGNLEALVRAQMPAAGLFREDWLRHDEQGWNLKIPRKRDARVLGEFLKARLQPRNFEWREFSQWRGFAFELGGEKLTAVQDKGPALALVIDDWGYHTKVLEAMKAFPTRLTVAVMPGLPHSRECAEAAFAAGHEVILHLPMEPLRPMPMLKGTLMVGMPDSEVTTLLDRHAESVPHMSGLNNHEGSKGSADTALMRSVCAWLASHGEYFLDSKTSAQSVGEAEAKRAGIPYEARRVFLDNVDEPKAIEKSAREAFAIAKKTGSCIAIGHPRPNTLAVLTRLAPEFVEAGVDLVRASELTHYEMKPDGR